MQRETLRRFSIVRVYLYFVNAFWSDRCALLCHAEERSRLLLTWSINKRRSISSMQRETLCRFSIIRGNSCAFVVLITIFRQNFISRKAR
jgi:hypothetical protein